MGGVGNSPFQLLSWWVVHAAYVCDIGFSRLALFAVGVVWEYINSILIFNKLDRFYIIAIERSSLPKFVLQCLCFHNCCPGPLADGFKPLNSGSSIGCSAKLVCFYIIGQK
jgi:hypothetical protein